MTHPKNVSRNERARRRPLVVAIVIMRSVRVVDDVAFWALDVLDAAYMVWCWRSLFVVSFPMFMWRGGVMQHCASAGRAGWTVE